MTNRKYSREFIDALRKVKGAEEWVEDEIDRAAQLESTLGYFINRYVGGMEKRTVLDFGCGCGASSVVLGNLASKVIGVEPKEVSVKAAQIRIKEEGLSGKVSIIHVPETRHLPFQSGSFDVVVAWGVLEHIAPKERPLCIQELWRVVAEEGYLFIGETPNRSFPYDAHTTRLWFVPWMPDALAVKYAIFRRRITAAADPIAAGMIGVTYREVLQSLPGGEFKVINLEKDDVGAYFNLALRHAQNVLRRIAKLAAVPFYILLEKAVCRPFGIPLSAFFPTFPALCFKKVRKAP